MAELDPLPLDDVLRLVEQRRRRRDRLVLTGAFGAATAVALAAAIGVDVTGDDDAPVQPPASTAAPTSDPVSTTSAPVALETWQSDALSDWVAAGNRYEDAAAIAAAWQVDPSTVKIVLGAGALHGVLGETDDVLRAPDDVQAELVAAFQGAYRYADAEVLAAAWGVPIEDAKVLIGVRALAALPATDE